MSGRITLYKSGDGPLWALGSTYFSKALVAACKAIPGVIWHDPDKTWRGYADAVSAVIARLELQGIKVFGPFVEGTADSWRTNPTPFLFARDGLRDYQIEGVRFLIAKASEGALLADGMRLGKTAQSLTAARAFKQKTLVICPSHVVGVWARPANAVEGPGEIAKWWPDAWKAPAEVVCLESIKPAKAKESEVAGYVEKIAHAQIVVCHYEIVYAWVDVLIAWGVSTLILDECFPAKTKIDTPNGQKSIDDIRPGEEISNVVGTSRVEAVRTRTAFAECMRLVQTDDGKEFIATRGHPFLTTTGWVTAGSLMRGDRLVLQDSMAMLTKTDVRQDYLGKNLLSEDSTEVASEGMFVLSKDGTYRSARSMLLKVLCDEIQLDQVRICDQSTPCSRHVGVSKETGTGCQEISAKGPDYRSAFVREDEKKQSYVDAWCKDQSNSVIQDTGVFSFEPKDKRGQWPTGAKVREHTSNSVRAIMGASASCANKKTKGHGVPDVLQDRRGASAPEDCNRSRRPQSRQPQTKNVRQEARRLFEGPRVVRVTVPKRADFERLGLCPPSDKGYVQVYNLQVTGHPSYSVQGVIVHNCHILASHDSRRSKAIKRLRTVSKRCMVLTGTPVANNPAKTHNLLDIIAPGRFGYFSKGYDLQTGIFKQGAYATVFCGSHLETVGKGEGMKTVPKHDGKTNLDKPDGVLCLTQQETLSARLKFMMLRRLAKDVDKELPVKTRMIVDVQIPAKKVIRVSGGMLGKDGRELRRCLDLAADGKLKAVVELVASHVNEGESVIVGCFRRRFAEEVATGVLKKVGEDAKVDFVHGGLTPKERDVRIHTLRTWQGGPVCLAGTIDTIGTGIDLSFAGGIIVAEFTWDAHDLEQLEERLYKVGKGGKAWVKYVVARGTGDELVVRGVISKLDTADKIVGETRSGLKEDLAKRREGSLARLAAALKEMQRAK